jgi:hypothetical protein
MAGTGATGIDTRKQALDAYLVARSADDFHVESRPDTQAIITRKVLSPVFSNESV